MVNVAQMRKAGASPRRRRLVRLALGAVLLLALTPFLLLVLYRFVNPISTPMVYERLTGTAVAREWRPLTEISPALIRSVMVAEDSRFCSHRGVDWEAVQTVLDASAGTPRGASTIPMQTVKNLFLWQSRSYVRKGLEVPLAHAADFVLGKQRLMEIYLNIAEWGPGIFGAEAAARHYFGRSAANLTGYQAALLAATLPAPAVRNPGRPSPRLAAIASRLADRAAASGAYIGCLRPPA